MKTHQDHVAQIVVSAWLILQSGMPDHMVNEQIDMMIAHMARQLNVDEESLGLEYVYVAQLMTNGRVFETEKAKILLETVKVNPQVAKIEEAVMDFIEFVKDHAEKHAEIDKEG